MRARALADGKLVYMAVPRLAADHPFFLLDPHRLPRGPRDAASIKGAARAGRPVAIDDMQEIDLVVCGSVAVDRKGTRLGKGGGYSDLELGLLMDAGLVHPATTVATTVHPLQVADYDLPETAHDFRVHRIVTPEAIIRAGGSKTGPRGILWHELDDARIESIPVLAALAQVQEGSRARRSSRP